MQHVAYDVVKHAFTPANPARPAPSSARAADSPFESLLNDGTEAANDPPAPPPPDSRDKTAAAAKSTAAQPPAKPADGEAAESTDTNKPADAGPAAAPDAVAKDGKASGDGKAATDAKILAQIAAAGDDTKPAGDGKPADGSAPTVLSADATVNPIQTNAPAAVVTTVVTPAGIADSTPAPLSQAVPPADLPTVAGTDPQTAPVGANSDRTGIFIADAANAQVAYPAVAQAGVPKVKTADVTAPKTAAGKTADDSTAPAKASFALPGDGTPQPAAGDASKPDPAHPHVEVAANTHHADASPPVATDTQAAAPKTMLDASQQASLTPQLHDVSSAPTNPAAPTLPTPPAVAVPLAGVAFEIAGKALAGNSHFEIRLDPPELGRIEVRLNVDRDGHITSHLIADRPDTLNLLRRDASGLERTLQDAGLKTADNGLQFSLRDQSTGRDQNNTPTPGTAQIVVNDDTLPVIDTTQRNYSRLAGIRGGIDIRV